MKRHVYTVVDELKKKKNNRDKCKIENAINTICDKKYQKPSSNEPISLELSDKEKEALIELMCETERDALVLH